MTLRSVDTVLDYLSLYWPLNNITLKELALKLVMLNTLTTGQRCQTLTFLDMSEKYMQRNGECFNFALTDHLKQDRPGKVFGNVRLYKYPVKELCVYEALIYYLKATENVRNSIRLLVSYIKPYRAVISSTIGRCIKTLIQSCFPPIELDVLQRVKLLHLFPLMLFLLQLVGLKSPHFVSFSTSQLL